MWKDVIRDRAGQIGWGHPGELVNTIQRTVVNPVGSVAPLKEGCALVGWCFVSIKERLG